MVEMLRDGPRTVGAIACALGLAQPVVSKHLLLLRRAGLVDVVPRAQQRFYSLRPERWQEIHDWVDDQLKAAMLQYNREARMYTFIWLGNKKNNLTSLKAFSGDLLAGLPWVEKGGKAHIGVHLAREPGRIAFAYMDSDGDGQYLVAVLDTSVREHRVLENPVRLDVVRHLNSDNPDTVAMHGNSTTVGHEHAANLLFDALIGNLPR